MPLHDVEVEYHEVDVDGVRNDRDYALLIGFLIGSRVQIWHLNTVSLSADAMTMPSAAREAVKSWDPYLHPGGLSDDSGDDLHADLYADLYADYDSS